MREVKASLHKVIKCCFPQKIYQPKIQITELTGFQLGDSKYEPVSSKRLHALAIDPLLSDVIQNHWALYPDHVVFLAPRLYF